MPASRALLDHSIEESLYLFRQSKRGTSDAFIEAGEQDYNTDRSRERSGRLNICVQRNTNGGLFRMGEAAIFS
jgi:hypothetical protein